MSIPKYSILAGILFSWAIGGIALAQAPGAGFQVNQEVRNLTKQESAWANSVQQANPGDRIEVRLTITWQGANPTHNVLVRQALPKEFSYASSTLRLDGISLGGDVTQENIDIGTMGNAQTKVLTFEAAAGNAEVFPAGTTDYVSTAIVFNADGGATDVSTMQVMRTGVPTDVSTGPLSMWMIGIVLLFAAAFAGTTFLFVRSYIRREVLESPYETRIDRKLSTSVDRIRKQEKK